MHRQFLRNKHTLSQLQGIVSKMKVTKQHQFPRGILKYGNSNMFNYATSKDTKESDLKRDRLQIWDSLTKSELDAIAMRIPQNGFEEMILLTEQGKMWHYPIDNEAGLEEKQISYEEHIFLDKHLEDFPKSPNIRSLMELVCMGLSKNPYMNIERKINVIKFYKDYFEAKRDTYKIAGYDMDN